MVGLAVIIAWGSGCSVILLSILKFIQKDGIRVSKDDELLGLDFKYHDG